MYRRTDVLACLLDSSATVAALRTQPAGHLSRLTQQLAIVVSRISFSGISLPRTPIPRISIPSSSVSGRVPTAVSQTSDERSGSGDLLTAKGRQPKRQDNHLAHQTDHSPSDRNGKPPRPVRSSCSVDRRQAAPVVVKWSASCSLETFSRVKEQCPKARINNTRRGDRGQQTEDSFDPQCLHRSVHALSTVSAHFQAFGANAGLSRDLRPRSADSD